MDLGTQQAASGAVTEGHTAPAPILLAPGRGALCAQRTSAADGAPAAAADAADPHQQLLPADLELAAALLGVSNGRLEQPDTSAATTHGAVTAAAAAALGARQCAASADLLHALLRSCATGIVAAVMGSALLLEVQAGANGADSRVVLSGLRTALLAQAAGKPATALTATAATGAATLAQPGQEDTMVLFDFDQPIVVLEALQLGQPQPTPRGSDDATAAVAATDATDPSACADALLLVGARGRVLLLHAAPARLPPALAPLLRVLHPQGPRGGGSEGLCVNHLSAHERQLPLRVAQACLVPCGSGPNGRLAAQLALLTPRGALYACELLQGDTAAAAEGQVPQQPLPSHLSVRPVPLPARATALKAASSRGCVVAVAPDGRHTEVDLCSPDSFLAPQPAVGGGESTITDATAVRNEVRGAAAALERLSALRERLRRRNAALESAYTSAAGELALLGSLGPKGASCSSNHHSGWGGLMASLGAAAVPAATLVSGAWGGAGALAARLTIEAAWAAPATAACGAASAPLIHLSTRVRLVNTSPHHALGPGWQLLLQWVPDRSEQPGWQTGATIAPLPPRGTAAAALLLPVPSTSWQRPLAGGWVQLLLVKPATPAGCVSGGAADYSTAGPPGPAAVAVLARVRVGALQLSRLLHECQRGTCWADPVNTPLSHRSGPTAAHGRVCSCIMHLRMQPVACDAATTGTGAAKRRRLLDLGEGARGDGDDPNMRARDQSAPTLGPQKGIADAHEPLGDWLRAALGCGELYNSSGAQAVQVPLVGGGMVQADWSPPPAGPGAAVLPQAAQSEGSLVLRLRGSSAPALAAARGPLIESLTAQLRLQSSSKASPAAAAVATRQPRATTATPGGDEAVPPPGKVSAVESDRPRLQQALRRLQALQAHTAQLRAQLSDALGLRNALDAAACAGTEPFRLPVARDSSSSSSSSGGDDVQRLVEAAAVLAGGVESAYGHMLLAVTDATRIVMTAPNASSQ